MVQPTEIQWVAIANNGGNLCNGIVCGFQQALSIVHAQIDNILFGRYTIHLFEIAHKQADAHMAGLCKLINADGFVVVFVEVLPHIVHFFLYMAVNDRWFFQTIPLHQNQKLPKAHLQKLLIPHPAGL